MLFQINFLWIEVMVIWIVAPFIMVVGNQLFGGRD
jgi:hypothetical protein